MSPRQQHHHAYRHSHPKNEQQKNGQHAPRLHLERFQFLVVVPGGEHAVHQAHALRTEPIQHPHPTAQQPKCEVARNPNQEVLHHSAGKDFKTRVQLGKW